jgi:hypothetical protein
VVLLLNTHLPLCQFLKQVYDMWKRCPSKTTASRLCGRWLVYQELVNLMIFIGRKCIREHIGGWLWESTGGGEKTCTGKVLTGIVTRGWGPIQDSVPFELGNNRHRTAMLFSCAVSEHARSEGSILFAVMERNRREKRTESCPQDRNHLTPTRLANATCRC